MRGFILLLIFLLILSGSLAGNVYLFYGQGCKHCAAEMKFFDEQGIDYFAYEVWYNSSNQELFQDFAEAYNTTTISVPRTFIGDKVFVGFDPSEGVLSYSEQHGAFIGFSNILLKQAKSAIIEPLTIVNNGVEAVTNATAVNDDAKNSELTEINLPLVGRISIEGVSILWLTVIMGLLDGLNPCAMWILSFLLAFTIATRSRLRMFLTGGIFILVSGFVYFLFITAWLNVFISMQAVNFIRILAGLLALAAGIINIKDYFAFQKGISLTVPKPWQPWIKKKMKYISIATGVGFLLSVLFLAFAINLVELLCTIGFPVIYLNVLSAQGFPTSLNYFYIILYVIMYLLDDTLIFLAAVFMLSKVNMNKKRVRQLKLFSGIIILLLAIALIFYPELLMFG